MGICVASTARFYRHFYVLVLFAAAVVLPATGLMGQTPANTPAACEPLPAGKKADFCYSHPAIAGKCVMFVAKDTGALYFSPAKGKVLTLSKPKSAALADMLKFLSANPKVKFKPEDILLIQSSLPLWDSVMVNLGFTELPSGLAYKVIQEGSGKLPEKNKRVQVHYRGYFMDGKEFDNSFKRGQPIDIVLGAGQVIKGWDEGIGLFKVGSKGTLRIPYGMAYGERGIPGVIPAKATLFFDIEVVSAD
jgi:hypothetical protein